ncbi:hypothetical protein ACHAWF_017473 [Thalassiosira exigua]
MSAPPLRRRRSALAASLAALLSGPRGVVDAFSAPDLRTARTSSARPPSPAAAGGAAPRGRSLAAVPDDDRSGGRDAEVRPPAAGGSDVLGELGELARPLGAAAASAFLAASLLFSSPLLPPPAAHAAPPPSSASSTATSIEVDLRSLPALTRKAVANRDKLTNYLIDSFKSLKPILDLLSESDAVTVKPPSDVKGAINQALTKGDAQFIVNGESVDVRVESVPGVIVVRVINEKIPRLPFLRDGTAALKFVDDIVDVAPAELEKAAEEVEAVEKFLTWGAPNRKPIEYEGSTLDYFLRSKFLWNGETVSLGALGELTNFEVVVLGVSTGVAGAYSASYAYYVSLREEAEREAQEKKEKVAAKKKAKAAADKAKAQKAEAEAEAAEEVEAKAKVEGVSNAYGEAAQAGKGGEEEAAVAASSSGEAPRKKKRDVVKKIFGRGKQ